MSALDESQCAQWRRHGYVLLRQNLSVYQREELARWVEELAAWPEAPGKWMKWYERSGDRRQLCRVEDFVDHHAGFAAFLERSELAAVLAQLCGEPAVLFKEKINFKLPGGAGFEPHQDAPAFTTFGQRYHVTVMVSVDPATVQNGCLEVVEGFHGTGLLPQAAYGTLDRAWSAAQRWKPIEMSPGDVLVFDSYVPHRSGPNGSQTPRRALYVTYNRASDGDYRRAYFARKRAAFPPECERAPGVDYTAAASVYNLGNPIT
jgi:ectoine hydroxylase-related dioxygenase (phytanoyl-CoA dioxygenase family)